MEFSQEWGIKTALRNCWTAKTSIINAFEMIQNNPSMLENVSQRA